MSYFVNELRAAVKIGRPARQAGDVHLLVQTYWHQSLLHYMYFVLGLGACWDVSIVNPIQQNIRYFIYVSLLHIQSEILNVLHT